MGYASATSSDASIYRTTLVATGLYNPVTRSWNPPEKLSDASLAEVWILLKEFYTQPADQPKQFSEVLDILARPPFGIRKGLFPIFITAALRAFGNVIAIRKHINGFWRYVDDIQPSTMEEICDDPSRHEIEVVHTTQEERELIRCLIGEFSPVPDTVETDLVRAFYDAVIGWQRNLPVATIKSHNLGDTATLFQRALRQTGGDPVALIFRAFPVIAGREKFDRQVVDCMIKARLQIEGMKGKIIENIIGMTCTAFTAGRETKERNAIKAARSWGDQIPLAVLANPALDQISSGILKRIQAVRVDQDSEASFVRSLTMMLVGHDFEDWDEIHGRRFVRELRMRIREIEDATLDYSSWEISPFVERKIESYTRKLVQISGHENARSFVLKLGKTLS